jgi:hypothetical protein
MEFPFLVSQKLGSLPLSSDSNMAASNVNATPSAQPERPQTWPFSTSDLQCTLPGFLAGWSTWQYVLTVLLGVVVYDQGKQNVESMAYFI